MGLEYNAGFFRPTAKFKLLWEFSWKLRGIFIEDTFFFNACGNRLYCGSRIINEIIKETKRKMKKGTKLIITY